MSASVAYSLEPYRKGTSFNDWFTRLKYLFRVNNVKEEDKMAFFITMSGPVILAEIKLLFPTGNFEEASLDDIVSKLKNRLDKTDPDLVQRYKFSTRVQNPDESTEDFILNLKLQAEFCGFDNFKGVAILDRLIAGIRDKHLRQRLLGEEALTLANAEKIIATWEVARVNAGTADQSNIGHPGMIAAVNSRSYEQRGVAAARLSQVYDLSRKYQGIRNNEGNTNNRGPVRSRLGFRPAERWQQTNRVGRGNEAVNYRTQNGRRQWVRPNYSQMICNYCGVKGHIRKKCFKLKNLHRDAVNIVDSFKPGPSADRHISELLERMQTRDDEEDDDSDTDMRWKRGNNGAQDADQSL
ncbi:uncharacterized protein LOC134219857 [Armigeres subalbatus]|uniref:uncharacterized protein LOC134219857 n=1 Tax=Armigeres subalbatus TaxID=124917 RepID=UPI002ED3AA23